MQEMSKQCVLKRNGAIQTSWIPAEFAEEGNFVKLKREGKWQDGWKVDTVYPFAMDSRVIDERSRDFKSHRKATDV